MRAISISRQTHSLAAPCRRWRHQRTRAFRPCRQRRHPAVAVPHGGPRDVPSGCDSLHEVLHARVHLQLRNGHRRARATARPNEADPNSLGNLDLHVFHASDAGRKLHDHPWSFISLILRGGYTEVMPVLSIRRMILDNGAMSGWSATESAHERARRHPGALLFRPANWAHRVELASGKKSVSILWTFPKRTDREWGFFAPDGWVNWRMYHDRKGCL